MTARRTAPCLLTCAWGILVVTMASATDLLADPRESHETFETLYQRGQALYEQGNFREATAAFERALALNDHPAPPASSEEPAAGTRQSPPLTGDERAAYQRALQQGEASYRQHRFQQAAEVFEHALTLQPTSEEAARWLVQAKEAQMHGALTAERSGTGMPDQPPSQIAAMPAPVSPQRGAAASASAQSSQDVVSTAPVEQAQVVQSNLTLTAGRARTEELEQITQTLSQREAALADAKQQLAQSDGRLRELEATHTTVKTEAEQLRTTLASKETELKRLQDQFATVQSDRDRLRSGMDQREAHLGQLQAELGSLQRELTAAQAELRQTQLDSQSRERQLIADREGSKWEADRLQRELERSQTASRQLAQERAHQEDRLNALAHSAVSQEDYQRLQDALAEAKGRLVKLEAELADRGRAIARLKSDVAQRERDVNESALALSMAQEALHASSPSASAPSSSGLRARPQTVPSTGE